jgi:predicted RNase H-like HicB family nuclease
MMDATRYVILYRDESDGWNAMVPSLPGCLSQGDTREEALANIKEAIALYLEDLPAERAEVYEEFVEPELVAVETVMH